MVIGVQIKKARLNAGFTQEQAAEVLGVSRQTISNWEHNNILPSIEMLIKIADFFSVSTDFLLERDFRTYIDVTGLSAEHRAHVQQIIHDILQRNC